MGKGKGVEGGDHAEGLTLGHPENRIIGAGRDLEGSVGSQDCPGDKQVGGLRGQGEFAGSFSLCLQVA